MLGCGWQRITLMEKLFFKNYVPNLQLKKILRDFQKNSINVVQKES